jgi:hypothetical protein
MDKTIPTTTAMIPMTTKDAWFVLDVVLIVGGVQVGSRRQLANRTGCRVLAARAIARFDQSSIAATPSRLRRSSPSFMAWIAPGA